MIHLTSGPDVVELWLSRGHYKYLVTYSWTFSNCWFLVRLSCFIRSRVKSVYHRLSLAELPDIPSVPELTKVSTSISDWFHSPVVITAALHAVLGSSPSGSMMSSMVDLTHFGIGWDFWRLSVVLTVTLILVIAKLLCDEAAGLRFSPILYPKVGSHTFSTPGFLCSDRGDDAHLSFSAGISANSKLWWAWGEQHLQVWSHLPEIWSGTSPPAHTLCPLSVFVSIFLLYSH